MDDREVPHYFICPISLQIMKDPVTVATGITYDRDSIQRWQFHGQNNTCPVTNQPLPIGADFTPNHNLRRLIQAWSVSDQLPPSNQPSLHKELATNLINNLKLPDKQLQSLKRLENLAADDHNENNKVCLKEVGVIRPVVTIVVSCYKNGTIVGLKEALNVLYLVGFAQDETTSSIINLDEEHDLIINSLTWVLDINFNSNSSSSDDDDATTMKFHAMVSLKNIINNAKPQVLERLRRDFFETIVRIIRQRQQDKKPEKGIKEGLHVMLSTCNWPRNCSMMIEAGAVFELVELELGSSPADKPTTELIMGVLFHLCCSADGRARLLGHAAGIAMITKRIGKVSQKVDERALMIISLISKFSATDGVLNEMVRVGTIEKLMMVLQVNGRHSYQRDKAREILKRHSNVWKDSPCLDVTLLTRYPS